MNSPDGGEAARVMSRIFLRPIGSPMPLGMLALAGASLMLTAYPLSWLPSAQGHAVAVALLAFAVPMQYLAAVFGFLGRDGAGGTGMALLGCAGLSSAASACSPRRVTAALSWACSCSSPAAPCWPPR
jgi:uncharacterized protein